MAWLWTMGVGWEGGREGDMRVGRLILLFWPWPFYKQNGALHVLPSHAEHALQCLLEAVTVGSEFKSCCPVGCPRSRFRRIRLFFAENQQKTQGPPNKLSHTALHSHTKQNSLPPRSVPAC